MRNCPNSFLEVVKITDEQSLMEAYSIKQLLRDKMTADNMWHRSESA